MHNAIHFLDRHGYAVLFLFALADQIGLPIPALPVLMAMGVLARDGRFSLPLAVATATAAALASDLFWYELGRRRGRAVLQLLCRISLEPDSCVRRAETLFSSTGGGALLVAKFLPGLSAMATPLAGIMRMRRWRFVLVDGAGAVLWSGALLGVGYLFHRELERIAEPALRLGGRLVVLLAAGLAAYIAGKWIQRERFIRRLRVARIAPEDLLARMQAGEDVVVVDLRHSIDYDGDGEKLPGAIHMSLEELDLGHEQIPRDRDVILYCT